jgi:DNA-binding transcriptional MerR regulator
MRKKPLTQISFDFDAPAPMPAPEPMRASEVTVVPEPVRATTSIVVEPAPSQPVIERKEVDVAPAVVETIEVDPAPAVGIRNVKIKRPVTTTAGKRGRKSIKEIESRVDLVRVPEDEELFKKQYYTIGEVAVMFSEKQSLIRYWESEFDILQPRKNRKGDRYFRPIDIKNLVLIYDLLRRRKFTIDGARDFLKKNKKAEERFALIQSLQKLRGFLQELRSNL